jgi:hypothetical protein
MKQLPWKRGLALNKKQEVIRVGYHFKKVNPHQDTSRFSSFFSQRNIALMMEQDERENRWLKTMTSNTPVLFDIK